MRLLNVIVLPALAWALLAEPVAWAQTTEARSGSVALAGQTQNRRLTGFSVVLVQGDLKAGAGTGDTLPPAAAAALADLKDFLPYKSYQLLDSQWTIGQDRVVSRLERPGQTYELELNARLLLPNSISVSRFVLREVGRRVSDSSAPLVNEARGAAGFEKAAERLVWAEQRLAELKKKFNPRHPEVQVAEDELQRLQADFQRARALRDGDTSTVVDTSFLMRMGETVVVGTSKIAGDRALIVLLTAVAR